MTKQIEMDATIKRYKKWFYIESEVPHSCEPSPFVTWNSPLSRFNDVADDSLFQYGVWRRYLAWTPVVPEWRRWVTWGT